MQQPKTRWMNQRERTRQPKKRPDQRLNQSSNQPVSQASGKSDNMKQSAIQAMKQSAKEALSASQPLDHHAHQPCFNHRDCFILYLVNHYQPLTKCVRSSSRGTAWPRRCDCATTLGALAPAILSRYEDSPSGRWLRRAMTLSW